MEHSQPFLWSLAESAVASGAWPWLAPLAYAALIAAVAGVFAFLSARTRSSRLAMLGVFTLAVCTWFLAKEVRYLGQNVLDAQRLQTKGRISILMKDYDVVYASHRSGKVMLREAENGGVMRLVDLRYATKNAQDATLPRNTAMPSADTR